jgi:hypothetical protein
MIDLYHIKNCIRCLDSAVDLVTLNTGMVVGISSSQVCLYKNVNAFRSNSGEVLGEINIPELPNPESEYLEVLLASDDKYGPYKFYDIVLETLLGYRHLDEFWEDNSNELDEFISNIILGYANSSSEQESKHTIKLRLMEIIAFIDRQN